MFVLVSAGQHIGEKVGAATKIVADASSGSGEVRDQIAADVAPGVERHVDVEAAQRFDKSPKLSWHIPAEFQFPGKRSPRKIKADYLVDESAIRKQVPGVRLHEQGDSTIGIGRAKCAEQ